MKIAYAFRRSTYYPFEAGAAWSLPDERALPDYLGKVRDIGFDGIELGLDNFLSDSSNGGLKVDEAGLMKSRSDSTTTARHASPFERAALSATRRRQNTTVSASKSRSKLHPLWARRS